MLLLDKPGSKSSSQPHGHSNIIYVVCLAFYGGIASQILARVHPQIMRFFRVAAPRALFRTSSCQTFPPSTLNQSFSHHPSSVEFQRFNPRPCPVDLIARIGPLHQSNFRPRPTPHLAVSVITCSFVPARRPLLVWRPSFELGRAAPGGRVYTRWHRGHT